MTTIAPPPADTGAPPELTPNGRKTFRGVLVAAAVVIVVGTLVALGVAAWGVSTVRVAADSHTLSPTMRSLSIDAGDVPVAIRITGDRDAREPRAELRVVNTSSGGDHQLTVTSEGAETRIRLEGRPSAIVDWARGGEITVSLPPEQARRMTVRTRQDTGVTLVQTDLDHLIAETSDGSVILGGGARSVEVKTVDGDVAARRPISVTERFAATTSDGDIAVDFGDTAPRTVEATSRSGDVVLGLPAEGPYLVRTESDQSSVVRVPETSDPARAAAQITARSESGDVVIEEVRSGRP
ncbi:hypothetical protein A5757_00640 [Mycobacterium sp. 852013-51886_SCH5428379]|uniref:DUF4097 family beta strand repeat-containing protein n=1 Tax=Mycobacterium sp. 852013-51886_SCH5428379 TaxID=1834111 RepID=UPI0007FDBC28|nr:DUF4097 family beta strand repeat-containing protein [Mycobacterium sp. 852013-51886_SCH5428379]OBB61168.1 hypothetical protein A5757_00640 [Mycobacterium sp. 852013-51886_SCH5428379]